jgi:hypothetical protein
VTDCARLALRVVEEAEVRVDGHARLLRRGPGTRDAPVEPA